MQRTCDVHGPETLAKAIEELVMVLALVEIRWYWCFGGGNGDVYSVVVILT